MPASMHKATADIFQALGLRQEDAIACADTLLYADTRGIDSHGVSNMMRAYVHWCRRYPQVGSVNPNWTMKVERDAPAIATVDCEEGLGLCVGPRAMDLAIEKAKRCGVGWVVVNNGWHYGACSAHASRALAHGCIGISMTIGGRLVVPTFGASAEVGLNPMCVAVPSGAEVPFIFDASMSSVAGNKITLAKRLGSTLPPGLISEPDGTPIMAPGRVPDKFMILPTGGSREMGSHKGYSLAAMIDVLSVQTLCLSCVRASVCL
jgi:L-2-hydroxycarboxylate dehydrogenase (NAD+)